MGELSMAMPEGLDGYDAFGPPPADPYGAPPPAAPPPRRPPSQPQPAPPDDSSPSHVNPMVRQPGAPSAPPPAAPAPGCPGAPPPGYPAVRVPAGSPARSLQPPMGQIEHERAHMLGLSVVGIGLGSAVGWHYGGGGGALAGTVFGGAAVNAYRAYHYFMEGTPDATKEAMINATYAVVLTGLAAWWWSENVAEGPAELTPNQPTPSEPCHIRPVGP